MSNRCTITEPFPDPILYDLIPLLLDFSDKDCTALNQSRWIPIAKVVAQAWHPGRLADCQCKLAEGGTAPPISAEEYQIGNLKYYLLTDGNHRTIARREAGRHKIWATVTGRSVCSADRTWIINGDAWRETEPNQLTRLCRRLSNEAIALLVTMGVRLGN